MVGWRGDQRDPGSGVAGLRYPWVHLVSRQLSTLARFGALGHLDLNVIAIDEVFAGDAETARGDLLDGRPLRITVGHGDVSLGVLTPLTGI